MAWGGRVREFQETKERQSSLLDRQKTHKLNRSCHAPCPHPGLFLSENPQQLTMLLLARLKYVSNKNRIHEMFVPSRTHL